MTTIPHNLPSMTIGELARHLCKDIVHGVFERGGRSFIVTRFSYPAGDSVNLYLVPGSGGELRISDMGTTHHVLRGAGIEMTEARVDTLRKICRAYGVEFDGQAFNRGLSVERAGADVLALCEAITRVSTVYYEARPRQMPSVARELDTLVSAAIEPVRPTVRDWFDPSVDPDGDHKVDYHFNSKGEARNLFVVTSRQKAEEVVGTVYFLESRRLGAPALAVIEPDLRLSQAAEKRLSKAAQLRHGVVGHEREIVGFALSGT